MGFKLKLVLMAAVFLLGVTGVAFAASGHLPEVLKNGPAAVTTTTDGQYGDRDGNAVDDQYGENDHADESGDSVAGGQYGHGDEVSGVAQDRDATETMELPNDREVENHGQAVRDAANQHESDGNAQDPPTATRGQDAAPSGGHDNEDSVSSGAGSTGTGTTAATGGSTGMRSGGGQRGGH